MSGRDAARGRRVVRSSVAEVPEFEADEITATQLAVNAEVEEGQFAYTALHLKADAQCPDVLELERRLLPNDLSLVPRLVMSWVGVRLHRWAPRQGANDDEPSPQEHALAALISIGVECHRGVSASLGHRQALSTAGGRWRQSFNCHT